MSNYDFKVGTIFENNPKINISDLKYVGQTVGNRISNTTNAIKNNLTTSVHNAKQSFSNMNNKKKIVTILLFFIMIFTLFMIIKRYYESMELHKLHRYPLFFENPSNALTIYKDSINNIIDGKIPRNKLENDNTPLTNLFTYNVWLYFDYSSNLNSERWWEENIDKWKHIFHRGSYEDNEPKFEFPGIYLTPNNNLSINFKSIDGPEYGESTLIDTFPLSKWFMLTISFNNNYSTIYINGKILKNITIWHSAINYHDYSLYVCQKLKSGDTFVSGYNGKIHNLQYFPNMELTPKQVINIYNYDLKKYYNK